MKIAKLFLIGLLCMVFTAGCVKAPPESRGLFDFDAQGGTEKITQQRLAQATMLTVNVNHCEYGEPTQTIDDKTVIEAVCEALSQMTVTGLKDKMGSTADTTTYSLSDAAGKTICWFSFQEGLLLGKDGRYTVEGLDALEAVDGILLADDWLEYWETQNEE